MNITKGIRKCEVFACSNPGARMYQIAPATNVLLCEECIQEADRLK